MLTKTEIELEGRIRPEVGLEGKSHISNYEPVIYFGGHGSFLCGH